MSVRSRKACIFYIWIMKKTGMWRNSLRFRWSSNEIFRYFIGNKIVLTISKNHSIYLLKVSFFGNFYVDLSTMKKMTLDKVKDKYIGKKGTPKRDEYEFDLQIDLIGEMIKSVRKERNLTQEELGQLVGVQKSQISKLEKGSKNVTIATILKIFDALKAQIKFKVELMEKAA